MKIALVAEEASALARPMGSEPATQETRVAALAETLAGQNHDVTIYARKDAADLPDEDKLPGGVRVEYIAAGPAEVLADEALASLSAPNDRQRVAVWVRRFLTTA